MARIGGAFPFPTAQVAEGGGAICLASGQYFYPGPGEGLVSIGALTAFEYLDPIAQVWRSLAVDYIAVDGYNWRLHNTSGSVTATAITAAGTGGTNGIGAVATGVNVAVAAAPAGGRTATIAPIVGGSVQAPTVAQGGSGFLVAPLVVIDPPPAGGIQATAVATISSGGAVSAITMVNVGAGYTASPNFWLIPVTNQYQGSPIAGVAAGVIPPGGLVFPGNAVPGNQNTSSTGAQLVSNALTGSGTLTGLKVIDAGAGYTAASPAVSISGTVVGATATATVGNTTPANDTSFFQPRVQ